MSLTQVLVCDEAGCFESVPLRDPTQFGEAYDDALAAGWAIVFTDEAPSGMRHFCEAHGPERDGGCWIANK